MKIYTVLDLFMAFMIGVGIMWGVTLVIDVGARTSYRQGQIDALTGTVKYELQTQSDSTRVWVEKHELD